MPNDAPGTVYWIDHYTVCTNDLPRFSAFHAQVLGGKQWIGPTGFEMFQSVARSKTGGFMLDSAAPALPRARTGLPALRVLRRSRRPRPAPGAA